MSSILNKIEDKLSGSRKEDRNTLEKPYDSSPTNGGDSKFRHPISNSTTDNAGYGGNRTSDSYNNSPAVDRDRDRDGYGRDGYGTAHSTGNSGMPGEFPTHDSSNRREYDDGNYGGNPTVKTTTHTNTTTNTTGPNSALKSATTGTNTYPNTTQREDYADSPARSSKGGILNQQREEDPRYTSTRENRDAIPTAGNRTIGTNNVPASDQRYERDTGATTSDRYGRDTGATTSDRYGRDTGATTSDRYGRDTGTTSEHHYGRDAGLVGGAGAAGVGAYEYGKHSDRDRDRDREPGNSSSNYGRDPPPRDVAYTSRDTSDANYIPNHQSAGRGTGGASQYGNKGTTSGLAGLTGTGGSGRDPDTYDSQGSHRQHDTYGTSGVTPHGAYSRDEDFNAVPSRTHARKMGEAYARGYEDGYEHAKAEMRQGKKF